MEGKWDAYAECENARIAEVRTDAKGRRKIEASSNWDARFVFARRLGTEEDVALHVAEILFDLILHKTIKTYPSTKYIFFRLVMRTVAQRQRFTKGEKELSDANHAVQKGGRLDYALPG